jgi:hypothetical protein
MKKLIYIICAFLLYGCPFTYDPLRGLLYIRNDSGEAVYVYFKCGDTDSLPLVPKLELFAFFDNENMSMLDASGNPLKSGFFSPEYRINAYTFGSLQISGSRNHPRLPCYENNEDIITLFFIPEKTMRNYEWEEIYENQMFVQKTILTKEELENASWIYIYCP